MKDLFEGGDWEKEITKRVKAKLPDQSKITKDKPQSSTAKDDGESEIYKKGFKAGETGREEPGDSEALAPHPVYQRGMEAGREAQKKRAAQKNENFSGAVASFAMPIGKMQTRSGSKKKRRSKKK